MFSACLSELSGGVKLQMSKVETGSVTSLLLASSLFPYVPTPISVGTTSQINQRGDVNQDRHLSFIAITLKPSPDTSTQTL